MPKTTKPRKVTPRATQAEAEQRTSEVYRLLVKGASRPDILQYAISKWGLSIPMVDKYIKAATDKLKVKAVTIREAELGKALERREDLYRQALTTQQISVALQVDESRCKLLGLFPKPEVTTDEGGAERGYLLIPVRSK